MSRTAFLAAMLLASSAAANGQSPPVVEDVEWAPFRQHCLRLMEGLEALKAPLPARTAEALKALLNEEPADPDAATAAVQKLLDAQCLLAVADQHLPRPEAVKIASQP